MSDVHFDTSGLDGLRAAVDRAGHAAASEPLGEMFTLWEKRYLASMRRRFKRLSRGGGEWVGLKESTVKRRRKGRRGAVSKKSILIDIGTLFRGLSIGTPGNMNKRLANPPGIRVGFADAPHNDDAGMTIRKLAVIHDEGLGNVPSRPILVAPDQSVVNGMMRDAAKAMERILNEVSL